MRVSWAELAGDDPGGPRASAIGGPRMHDACSCTDGGDRQVGACIEQVVRGFREPRPGPTGGDITYRFPLEFEPAR